MKSRSMGMLVAGIVALGVSFGATVQAIPITGAITMGGSAEAGDSLGNPENDLSIATQFLSFGNPQAVTVTADSGAYSGTTGSTVTWTPFIWQPPTASTPVMDLWTFTAGGMTYSFNLTTLNTPVSGSFGGVSFLVLTGTGTALISGGTYDPTYGNWELDATANGDAHFAFNSSEGSTGVAVPDGGTSVILLGIALSALGLVKPLRKHVV